MSGTLLNFGARAETLIAFDLRQVLTEEELQAFKANARQAGAPTLTEHFLNITLRIPEESVAKRAGVENHPDLFEPLPMAAEPATPRRKD